MMDTSVIERALPHAEWAVDHHLLDEDQAIEAIVDAMLDTAAIAVEE